jgi:hypothetical protein
VTADVDDDSPPAGPAEALWAIREQQTEAARRLGADPRVYFWPWGLAWLIGFGLLFLRHGPGGRVLVDMPDWLPLTVLFVLLGAAGTITAAMNARAFGNMPGASAQRGKWYAIAWFLSYGSMAATLIQVANNLPEDLRGLLWGASAVGVTGALHMAGGALWPDRRLFTLGVWITVTNIVAVIAGPGWHSLTVALAGGGGMLLVGTVGWIRQRP